MRPVREQCDELEQATHRRDSLLLTTLRAGSVRTGSLLSGMLAIESSSTLGNETMLEAVKTSKREFASRTLRTGRIKALYFQISDEVTHNVAGSGGPTSRTPFGMRPPSVANRSGSFKN